MSSLTEKSELQPDDAERAWTVLAEQVEQLVSAWDAGQTAPLLDPFLPPRSAALRRFLLIELIKVDLEYRWQHRHMPKTVEQYVAEFPELASADGAPADLIYEEYHVRRQAGEEVDPQGYFERFPRQASQLARLLGLEAPHLSTALVSAELLHRFEPGERIDDFDLLTLLGRGAFASVFLARQQSMQRLLALKISSDRGSEPQTMAQLDHPHIVRVYDQRTLADRKVRLLYMQYIAGPTLQAIVDVARLIAASERSGQTLLEAIDRSLVQRGEAPPSDSGLRQKLGAATWPEVVCWIGARVASALDYAHSQGVLHRDIKPANILLAADGSPKLVDFNISFSSKLEGATPAAYFGGSLGYMSPEQLEACNPAHERQPADLDGRSDIYSLGIVLFELLTGARPFRDEGLTDDWATTVAQMTERRRSGVPPQAIALLPHDCPRGMDQVVLKCLEPNVEDRFATSGELSRQLDLCLRPQVQNLLRPPARSWRQWMRRYATVAVLVLVAGGVLPNVVASLLNIPYNYDQIVSRLPQSAQLVFRGPVILWVNAIAYSAGTALMLSLAWPVVRGTARVGRRVELATEELRALRRRALVLGDYMALTTLGLWLISGVALPMGIRLGVREETSLNRADWLHFLTSQALCGLMAATLSFFLIEFLMVRVFYPVLLVPNSTSKDDLESLVALGRRIWLHFGLAVLVPFLAVIVLVFLDLDRKAIFGWLGGVGLAAFGISFLLAQTMRNDLVALSAAVSPEGDSLASTSALLDSSWRRTRR